MNNKGAYVKVLAAPSKSKEQYIGDIGYATECVDAGCRRVDFRKHMYRYPAAIFPEEYLEVVDIKDYPEVLI